MTKYTGIAYDLLYDINLYHQSLHGDLKIVIFEII